MKIKGKILFTLVAVLTVTASVLVSKPAWALCAYDAPCCGDSCRGQEPYLSGCDRGAVSLGGTSIKAGTTRLATVYLVHSPRCNSSWAEVESYGRSTLNAKAFLIRSVGSGVRYMAESPVVLLDVGNGYTVRSPMEAAGSYMQKACGFIFDDPLDDAFAGACTNYFHGLP